MTIEEVPPITAIQRVEELIGYLAHIVKELIEILNQAEQQIRKIQEHTRLGLGILKNGDGE